MSNLTLVVFVTKKVYYMYKSYTLVKYPPLEKNITYKQLNVEYSAIAKNLNIKHENFINLMDFCFENCEMLCFYISGDRFSSASLIRDVDSFLQSIETYKIKSIKCLVENDDNCIFVHLYECNRELKNALLEYTDNLFFQKYSPCLDQYIGNNKLPTDMCFIKNKKSFLSMQSNISLCCIKPQSVEHLEFFQKLVEGYAYFVQGVDEPLYSLDLKEIL